MAKLIEAEKVTATSVEWPTVLLIVAFWCALTTTVVLADLVPTALTIVLLPLLGGFYGSLQHEVIHRHPTSRQWLNRCLVVVPLSLFMPFDRYRQTHLQHHASDLTNPAEDPESYYVTAQEWRQSGSIGRLILVTNRTLVGRLTLGPGLGMGRYWRADLRLAHTDRRVAVTWMWHGLGVAGIVAIIIASPLQLWVYLVGFVYGGLALTMLRSFAEHCGDPTRERTAVVATGRFFSLLFLNNNLHIAHHDSPSTPWYELPTVGLELAIAERAHQGGTYYHGYRDVARQYGLHQFCQVVHPDPDQP